MGQPAYTFFFNQFIRQFFFLGKHSGYGGLWCCPFFSASQKKCGRCLPAADAAGNAGFFFALIIAATTAFFSFWSLQK
jgi:hypothetical protein